MLQRIGRIKRMKSRSKNRVTGNVIPPVVEGHPPRIRIGIIPKRDQALIIRPKPKPRAVPRPNRTIRGFHLGMMENRLPEKQVAVRRPDKVMQRVVGIFRPKSRQHLATVIRFSVPIGILEKTEVRLL